MKAFRILFMLLMLYSMSVSAQFLSVKMNVVGLTCSACSFGTERSIRQLGFVQDVKMDLNSNIAEVIFKTGSAVSIEQLVQKVYDAGFSVGKVIARYQFTTETLNGNTWQNGADTYTLLNTAPADLKGEKELTFVAPRYMSKNDYKPYKPQVDAVNALLGTNRGGRRYFVLL
jgi:copper chaperone CopZ